MAKHRRRILMLLENESFPDDSRVYLEATSLVAAGYDVTVVCRTGRFRKKVDCVDDVAVYRYPQPWMINGFIGHVLEYAYSLAMMAVYACYLFVRRGFDVIHVHTPPDLTALIAIFFKLFGKKFVFDLHDLSPELFQAQRDGKGSRLVQSVLLWFERLACRNANRLIATNQSQQRVQIERGGAIAHHCTVVRNGPHTTFLGEVQSHPDLASEQRTVIGYVGVIGVQDGVDYLIRALNSLKTKHGRNDFLGIIVGHGSFVLELKSQVAEFGLTDQVRFTGLVPFSDVPSYIAAFDICSTPDPSNSYNDSCTTIKTMEYMALGKPTVCFETTENRNTAGPAAQYVHNNDVEGYAAKLEQLMDDPQQRAEMGRLGRERIDAGLSWKHQAVNLISLYDDLFEVETNRLEGTVPLNA